MKTLKIGALALILMVAGSAAAFPGQKTLERLCNGYVSLVGRGGDAMEAKGWKKTATAFCNTMLFPGVYPKQTTAVVAAGLVATAIYFGYKKVVARNKAVIEETEAVETETTTVA